jgi:maltoporin
MKNSKLAVAICAALLSSSAFAVDFTGYVRSNVGVSQNGGVKGGDEFNKNMLGRLGNEYDTYAEIGLGQEMFNSDGKSMYIDTMFAMSSEGADNSEAISKDKADFAIQQVNLQAKGYLEFAPEATVWAGKRFYQRHDIHIIDSKYWNVSGYGVGVENVALDGGALSAAIIRGDGDEYVTDTTDGSDYNVYFLDTRYAFKPIDNSWAEIGIDYAITNPTDVQKEAGIELDNGVMLTGEFGYGFSFGWNKLVVQYGDKGLAQNMVSQGGGWYDIWQSDYEKASQATGYRIIATGDINVTDHFLIDHVITYGYAQDHKDWVDDEQMFSVVARPTYAWSDYNKTSLELGYFTDTKTWDSGSETKTGGSKITLAQSFTAGKEFLARPELRFYVSYLKDAENQSFNDSTDDNTLNFGVQLEAWW